MNCPKCGSHNIYVKDSRHRGGYVYRRRVCAECDEEFSTHEKIVVDMKLNSKDWECPVDDCEECEHHRGTSWCSLAIPNHEEIDAEYKIRQEEFFRGFHAAEEHYKVIVEVLDELDQKFVDGEYVEVVRCKECRYWQDQAEGIVESPICTRIHDMVFEMGATDSCTKAERREYDEFEEPDASEEN